MRTEDFKRFSDVMRQAFAVYDKVPSKAQLDVFWMAFSGWSIEQFSDAMQSHIVNPTRGQFMPKPADLVAAAHDKSQADGRPTAAEAWGIALEARDEATTVVWTVETRTAWHAAEPTLSHANDKVAARLTFVDVYNRMVEQARSRGEPVQWEVSQGHDPDRRQLAVEQAAHLNRLSSSVATALLKNIAPPLALPAPEPGGIDVVAKLQEIRAMLARQRAEREAAKANPEPKAAINVDALLKAGELLKTGT